MSYLGTVLDLDEGARLTGIGIQPLAREITDTDGYALAHVVRMPHGDDASEAGSAVTAFLTTAIACLSGNEPDGDTWFGIVQYASSHFDPELAEYTADAAISRALGLTRVSDSDVSSMAFTARELREAYPAAGADDVAFWSVPDLVVGLLIELTNADLQELVESSSHPTLTGDGLVEHRQQRLQAALHAWAATYEGPEHG